MTVLAHGLGGRSDLPVPLWLALYGGAAAVVVSFVALGALWPTPRLAARAGGKVLPTPLQRLADARTTRAALRAVGVAAWAVLLGTAVLGDQSAADNPAATWLYVWLWVGLVPVSLLLGPVWRAASPLRTLTTGIERLVGDPHGLGTAPLPPRLSYWPAAAGLAVFVWLELVYPHAARPFTVALFVVVYTLVHLAAAARFGQAWYRRGESFEVYATLLAHLSPLGRRPDGRLALRNPLAGLATIEADASLVAVICVLLGSTVFDGLTRTTLWEGLIARQGAGALLLAGTAGLAAAVGLVAATYAAATWLAGRVTGASASAWPLTRRFAHSLVPIAVGYTVAHYFSLFVFQGQAGYILASDPLARGWDLFGTAGWQIDYRLVSPQTIALVQVAAIVLGHVAGVVAAHDRAVTLFAGRDQNRSQYPLLAAMVAYTIAGIALLVGV
ncbi:MAG: hypothetical protein M3276_10005 [Actinomycetota bacterium]|nr:hypothetical protein [Actinomycetota bacterium]